MKVCFDKTGTLTEDALSVECAHCIVGSGRGRIFLKTTPASVTVSREKSAKEHCMEGGSVDECSSAKICAIKSILEVDSAIRDDDCFAETLLIIGCAVCHNLAMCVS